MLNRLYQLLGNWVGRSRYGIPRPANARLSHFMNASSILDCPVNQLGAFVLEKKVGAVVLMTHNVELDAAGLAAVADLRLTYLALLGPKTRRQEVVAAAGLIEEQIATGISGPAGIKLGGDLPEISCTIDYIGVPCLF